nr:MerR family DNA-binding transcriptional regulator [Mycobacterium parascrofulaceum]
MNVCELAKLTNATAKTIRSYEDSGFLSPSARSACGYRDYGRVAHLRGVTHTASPELLGHIQYGSGHLMDLRELTGLHKGSTSVLPVVSAVSTICVHR